MKKVYLACMGELFELSAKQYRAYLTELHATGSVDLKKYGKSLGNAHNVTDIRREDATVILQGGKCSWLPTLQGRPLIEVLDD